MKAKKLLLSILASLCFGFSAFAITSCGEHVHEWNSGEITKEETCRLDGVKTYKCESCDETKTEIIYSKGHTEVIDKAVNATCTKTGLTEGSHCDRCKEVLVKQEVVDALGHNYGEWYVTNEAGCESEGLKRRDCSACNHYEEETIEALKHIEVIDKAVNATCTETGLTEGSHCEVCKEVLVAQEVVPAGHIYSPIVTNPTCTAEGYTTYICEDCNYTYISDYVTAKGHENNYICSECGQINESYYTEGLKFTLSSNGTYYSVTGRGTATDTDILIPSVYNGKPVTCIGDSAFQGCSSLTSITIPNSVTSIGDYAFEYCSSLTSITIPDSVTTIGEYAFYDCSSLISVTIGNSVTSISDATFCDCTSLESVTIGNSVTIIGYGAFAYCTRLKSIIIPDSVTSIWALAFYECISLADVYYTGTSFQWKMINIVFHPFHDTFYDKDHYYLLTSTFHYNYKG